MSIGRRPDFLTASVLVFVLIGVWLLVGFYYDLLPNDGEAAVIPWEHDTPAAQGMSGTALQRLGTALAERGTAALLVIRNDVIVHEQYAPLQRWYAARSWRRAARLLLYPSGPPAGQLFGTASMGKAIIGGMALTLALCDGWLGLDDPASIYIPAWREDPAKTEITVRQLATHSSGLDHYSPWEGTDWKERYRKNPAARFAIALTETPMLFAPGSDLSYSNPGFSTLAYVLAASLRDTPWPDIRDLLSARIMQPLGIPPEAWSINYGRPAHRLDGLPLYEIGAGGRYTARAVARVGQLILHRGEWQGRQIIEGDCVDTAISSAETPLPEDWRDVRHPAPALGWWTNAEGAWSSAPTDTLVGAGAEHSVLVVIPSLDLVVVRLGSQPLGEARFGGDYWIALEHGLLEPLMRAVAEE